MCGTLVAKGEPTDVLESIINLAMCFQNAPTEVVTFPKLVLIVSVVNTGQGSLRCNAILLRILCVIRWERVPCASSLNLACFRMVPRFYPKARRTMIFREYATEYLGRSSRRPRSLAPAERTPRSPRVGSTGRSESAARVRPPRSSSLRFPDVLRSG